MHSKEDCRTKFSTSSIRVRKIEDWGEFLSLRSEWEALLIESETQSLFSTWEWIRAWWLAYGNRNKLFILAAYGPQGELLGIAPLYVTRRPFAFSPVRLIRIIGNNGDSGQLSFVVSAVKSRIVVNAFIQFLHASPEWDVLDLKNLATESVHSVELQSALSKRTWSLNAFTTLHPVIHLNGNWQEYVDSLSRKRRSTLNRSMRSLGGRFELRIRQCQSASDVPHFLKDLFTLHNKRWRAKGESSAFDDPRRKQFYEYLSSYALQRGWLDLWRLEVDEHVVAIEYGCIRNGVRYAMQSGFDPDFADYGVGTVLESHMIRHAIDRGCSEYDFIGGEEPHKARWRAKSYSYLNLRSARACSLGSFAIMCANILGKGAIAANSQAFQLN